MFLSSTVQNYYLSNQMILVPTIIKRLRPKLWQSSTSISLRWIYRVLVAFVFFTSELMIKVASEEGIKWIYSLLESEFIVMKNDGLLALSLLAALKNGTSVCA